MRRTEVRIRLLRLPACALLIVSQLTLAGPARVAAQTRAQQQQPDAAKVLRTKIERLEEIDSSSKSQTVQDIYRRSLLRLYEQYAAALRREIGDMKAVSAVVSDTDDVARNEIARQLKRLEGELDVTGEKIQTLRGDLGTAQAAASAPDEASPADTWPAASGPNLAAEGVAVSAHPAPAPREDEAPAAATARRPGSSVAAAQETRTAKIIKGRVTVINEHFFRNAGRFSREEIRQAVRNYNRDVTKLDTRQEGEACTPIAKRTGTQVTVQVEDERRGPLPDAQSAAIRDDRRVDERSEAGELVLKKEYRRKAEVSLVEVKVTAARLAADGNSTPAASDITDEGGCFTLPLPADSPAGNYVISVSHGNFSAQESVYVSETGADPAVVDLQLLVRPLGEFSRAIVGFEQAGASAARSTQKYFFDLTLSAPLPFQRNVDPYFGPRSRAWGTVRVTSVPQQVTSPVGQFATGFAQQVSNVKVNEVAQAIEFLAGVDVRLTDKMWTFGSFDGKTSNKFTLSFIAAGGAITPLNPRDTLETFRIFPGAAGLPPIPPGKEFITFVSPDRDRFFRQFYAGIRAQGYYFDYKNSDIPLKRYPATLDITYGMNESVTGGRLRGGVIRIEGFYPLPYEDLSFVNLFGTALIKPTRTQISDPLILEPAPAGTTVPANNVLLVTVPQINRDYYRVGVGVDFVSLIRKLKTQNQN